MSRLTGSRLWAGSLAVAARGLAAVSPRLAEPLVSRLWFTPWDAETRRALERQRAWLQGVERVSIPAGDRVLAGFTMGEGPVVLLVHGWGERGATLRSFVDPLVARGFRVVGVDLPAHGDTPGGQANAYEVSAAVRAAAEHLGGVEAVVAHSMGSLITLLAISEGLSVRRVVLVSPVVRIEHALERFTELFRLNDRARGALRTRMERRFGADIWSRAASDALARDLDLPGLILHSRDDPQVSFEDAVLLSEAWEGSELVLTDGLGHGRILRDPEVIERVTSFVATPARQPHNA